MRFHSLTSGIAFALLFSSPIASGYAFGTNVPEKRHSGSLASIASRLVHILPRIDTAQVPPPDEFGSWDSDEDEFGSWTDKIKREPMPHHTEGQIAAKKAAALRKGKNTNQARSPHHTEAQIDAKKKAAQDKKSRPQARQAPAADDFGPWDAEEDEFGSWVDKREPHHTEAQIAAKEKAAGQRNKSKNQNQSRDPHHTEAQVAAKEKAAAAQTQKAAGSGTDNATAGSDTTATDRKNRCNGKRSPHHTEAQKAAKERAQAVGVSQNDC